VEQAIAAHGGEKELGRLQICQTYFAGKVHNKELDWSFTMETWRDGAKRYRDDMKMEIAGQKLRALSIVSGDRGWTKAEGYAQSGVSDMTDDEARQYAYAASLTTLTPLLGPEIKLTEGKEVKVEDRPAYGVIVSCANQADVQLFFDKETRLLVKMERTDRREGGEWTFETFYQDHEPAGLRQPRKIKSTAKNPAGEIVETVDMEVNGYTPKDRAEDELFQKP
jgi:deoxyribodipyrimidine photolyase-like uncharacterized protein